MDDGRGPVALAGLAATLLITSPLVLATVRRRTALHRRPHVTNQLDVVGPELVRPSLSPVSASERSF
jgi:hypothetical protein